MLRERIGGMRRIGVRLRLCERLLRWGGVVGYTALCWAACYRYNCMVILRSLRSSYKLVQELISQ